MDFRIYKPECPTRHMKQWEARIPGNTQLVTPLKQVCRVVTQTQKHPHWQDFLEWPTTLGKIQRSTICPDSPGSCIPRKFVNHAIKTMHIKELGSKFKHWTQIFSCIILPQAAEGCAGGGRILTALQSAEHGLGIGRPGVTTTVTPKCAPYKGEPRLYTKLAPPDQVPMEARIHANWVQVEFRLSIQIPDHMKIISAPGPFPQTLPVGCLALILPSWYVMCPLENIIFTWSLWKPTLDKHKIKTNWPSMNVLGHMPLPLPKKQSRPSPTRERLFYQNAQSCLVIWLIERNKFRGKKKEKQVYLISSLPK